MTPKDEAILFAERTLAMRFPEDHTSCRCNPSDAGAPVVLVNLNSLRWDEAIDQAESFTAFLDQRFRGQSIPLGCEVASAHSAA